MQPWHKCIELWERVPQGAGVQRAPARPAPQRLRGMHKDCPYSWGTRMRCAGATTRALQEHIVCRRDGGYQCERAQQAPPGSEGPQCEATSLCSAGGTEGTQQTSKQPGESAPDGPAQAGGPAGAAARVAPLQMAVSGVHATATAAAQDVDAAAAAAHEELLAGSQAEAVSGMCNRVSAARGGGGSGVRGTAPSSPAEPCNSAAEHPQGPCLCIAKAPAEALLPFKRGRELYPAFVVEVRRPVCAHVTVPASSHRMHARRRLHALPDGLLRTA